MNIFDWQKSNQQQRADLLSRPAISASSNVTKTVANILQQVLQSGDSALKTLNKQFDHTQTKQLNIDQNTIQAAANNVSTELKNAIKTAYRNIETFHQAQVYQTINVETMVGVNCQSVTRPIESVGLYIPGGTAPLLSTVLMLGIPAKIAGCQKIVLCSPPPIANEILYAASLCGIEQIYQVGGAQAIAAMAFGTESIPKVDKIFGPGNSYVTEAKRQVSQVHNGAAIDMPAGPSEVLVIADSKANPAFIAADLLSQAEHGVDSQVIFVTPDINIAQAVKSEVAKQLIKLPRKIIAEQALSNSRLIVVDDLETAFTVSNQYAPEHLIVQIENAEQYTDKIINAGSVFLGEWSPESVGDYASGTNHVLPTYGYAKTYSSLGLADFQKRMTIQKLTSEGLLNIASTVIEMTQAEQLIGHQRAVTIRIKSLNDAKQ